MIRPVVAALLALLLAAPTASARPKLKPCPSDVVAETWAAKLYVTSTSGGGYDAYSLRSCVKGTRKRSVLARWYRYGSSTDDPEPQYWLSGRYAAVNQAHCSGDPTDPDPCSGALKVVNLRTGKRVATVPTRDRLIDFAMTEGGTVALIHRRRLMLVRGADVQELDTAALTGSMAFAPAAQTLYWTSGGQPRSTPMS